MATVDVGVLLEGGRASLEPCDEIGLVLRLLEREVVWVLRSARALGGAVLVNIHPSPGPALLDMNGVGLSVLHGHTAEPVPYLAVIVLEVVILARVDRGHLLEYGGREHLVLDRARKAADSCS